MKKMSSFIVILGIFTVTFGQKVDESAVVSVQYKNDQWNVSIADSQYWH